MARGLNPNADHCWWTASAAKAEHRLRAIGSHTIRIELAQSSLLAAPFELLYRNPDPPVIEGTEITQCNAVIRVTSTGSASSAQLELVLPIALDDPDLVLLA
jgi:hypothetical protein